MTAPIPTPPDPHQRSDRLDRLAAWLAPLAGRFGLDPATLAPASSDASFRRYFRVQSAGAASYIVMDAPPPKEDVRPFVDVAGRLAHAGVWVPQVLASDVEAGFLLLSDLGERTYLSALSAENAPGLYQSAIEALVRFQKNAPGQGLAPYDEKLLRYELELFPEWYLGRHLGLALSEKETKGLERAFRVLIDSARAEPQVFVHRDYHSRNLMLPSADHPGRGPGILDFQDAVLGAVSYDLVSLLRDAYIAWPEETVLDWAVRYWEKARAAGVPVREDFGEFWRDFEWMGLQRHLKVLGIFARLWHRDGKDGYLKDMPLVLQYARAVAFRYDVFRPLAALLERCAGSTLGTGYTF